MTVAYDSRPGCHSSVGIRKTMTTRAQKVPDNGLSTMMMMMRRMMCFSYSVVPLLFSVHHL